MRRAALPTALPVVLPAALIAVLTGCGSGTAGPAAASAPAQLVVTSSAFAQGGVIPDRYTCKGAGTSLPVSWKGVPAGTGWLALYMEDPTASDFTHWYVVDMPVRTTGVAEGQAPAGHAVARYFPPCPPAGGTDDYVVRVYAMPGDYRPAELGNVPVVDASGLAAHALAVGSIDGTVSRPA